MRRAWRVLRWVLAAVAVLVATAVGVGWYNLGRGFPQVEGRLVVAGLGGEVEIVRDADGVPHIYADTVHDLFFAQGFVEAQDRFYQMDVFRHIGKGSLSEMFGADSLDADRYLRTLDWDDLAEADLTRLSPETTGILESYAAGVNAYTDDRSGGRLSFGHFLLGTLRSYHPSEWTPSDSLGFTRLMAFELSGNLEEEIERSMLAGAMPVDRVEELYPSHPEGFATIVPSGSPSGIRRAPSPIAVGVVDRWAESSAMGSLLGGPEAEGIGSNNWAVSGALTATGQPLLANDPHMMIRMPSLWYEVGLHCRKVSSDCPYDVTGFGLPGVPAVIIGHNADVAWGFTNLKPDGMDLFVEKLHPDDPNLYEFRGEWVEMDVRTEIIEVAGGEPETLVVRSTHHGPIIGEVYGSLEDFDEAGLALPDRYALALSWDALRPSSILDGVLEMNLASDWAEFSDAIRRWNMVGQNAAYADRHGTIGYRATGSVPIRAQGDGRWPVPGWTGDHEWVGWVPFEEMPALVDPEPGYVVTANQPVVGGEFPHLIHTDSRYGYRADRIATLIEEAPGPIDADYMRYMQMDAYNAAGPILVPAVLALPLGSEEVAVAQAVLSDWSQGADDPHSGAYQMRAGQPGAALFAALWRHLLEAAFADDLPEPVLPGGGGRWFRIVENLLDDPRSPWWDDSETGEVETRDDILIEAVVAAVDELGSDPGSWNWEEMHTATFAEPTLGQLPLLGRIFNSSAYPVPGGSSVVNATWWDPRHDSYDALAVPTMRMVIDLGDFSNSTAINSTGQSGHPSHPHYDDMIGRWARNEQHPMRWSRNEVEADGASILVLVPPGRGGP